MSTPVDATSTHFVFVDAVHPVSLLVPWHSAPRIEAIRLPAHRTTPPTGRIVRSQECLNSTDPSDRRIGDVDTRASPSIEVRETLSRRVPRHPLDATSHTRVATSLAAAVKPFSRQRTGPRLSEVTVLRGGNTMQRRSSVVFICCFTLLVVGALPCGAANRPRAWP